MENCLGVYIDLETCINFAEL